MTMVRRAREHTHTHCNFVGKGFGKGGGEKVSGRVEKGWKVRVRKIVVRVGLRDWATGMGGGGRG